MTTHHTNSKRRETIKISPFRVLSDKLELFILKLVVISTFVAMPVLLYYIYINLIYTDIIKVLLGCIVLLVNLHLNKGVRGA